VTCGDPNLCQGFTGQQVDVHAVINVPGNPPGCINLPVTQDVSSGTLTQTSGSAFDSTFANVQAQIIAVPPGGDVNGTPVFSQLGPATGMSATGGVLSPNPPPGYPNSTCFPTIPPYVIAVAGGPGPLLRRLATGSVGRVFRASLWGLGSLFLGFALVMFRRSAKNGRLNLRPVYMAGLAVLAWFVAWRAPTHPRIVYANGAANGASAISAIATTSCSINFEQATLIQHGVAPAQSGPCQ
jgi:hypothetical protein